VAALIEQLPPAAPDTGPVSKFAIDSLYAPVKRPSELEARAKQILEKRNSVSHQVAKKQEPVASTPKERLRIPTGARVGATATIKDGIALGDISLIGIYGTTKTRRALVRLPQGRYVQISRGDRVSGWTVSAVSEDAVRIQKGSKNMVLRLPN
jgi:type IV pilus biogenesis protein PilP